MIVNQGHFSVAQVLLLEYLFHNHQVHCTPFMVAMLYFMCYTLLPSSDQKEKHQDTHNLMNAAHNVCFLFTIYFLCTALDHYVHPVMVNRTEKEHMNRIFTQFSNT